MHRAVIFLFCVGCILWLILTSSASQPTHADTRDAAIKPSRVAAGDMHTCALFSDGTVKCWGNNDAGQLGYGDTTQRGVSAGTMGSFLPAVNLGTGKTVKDVVSGGYFTCAVLNDDSLKCWGSNAFGQLGTASPSYIGNGPDQMGDMLNTVNLGSGRTVRAVAPGNQFMCALLDDRNVKCWGTAVTYAVSERMDFNGGLFGDSLPAVNLGTGVLVDQIAAGTNHVCAVLTTGAVKCWGLARDGQLGNGGLTPVGDDPSAMGDSLPIVALGTGRTAVSIAAGANHTCALLDNATVKCWGQNANGQLGIGSTDTKGDSVSEMGNALPIVSLGTGRTAKRIYAGGDNTCAILDNDTTKCWGANVWFAQLGDGTKVNKGTSPTQMGNALAPLKLGGSLTITHMEIGGGHMCAVLNSNGVKCWGANSNEQLGSIYNWTLGIDEDLSYVDLGTTIETVPTTTKTKSPTRTPTRSKTLTRSKTPTRTRTMTRSMTPSKTRTATRTSTATKTPSPTP